MNLSKAVHSLIYPETKSVIQKLWQTEPFHLYDQAYSRDVGIYNSNLLDAWKKFSSPVIQVNYGLYNHCYTTNGSTESLRETLVQHLVFCQKNQIAPVLHIFTGEYEGYEALAKNYAIKIVKHQRTTWQESIKTIKPYDCFFLSQPSSIDGNVWSQYDDFMGEINKIPEVKVLVDVCYVGCVSREFKVNLNYPCIKQFCFSLSKVFGVFYHRIGGVLSTTPLPGLKGHVWFKNIFSLELGTQLLNQFTVFELPKKYQPLQAEALKILPGWNASDVIILAYSLTKGPTHQEFFRGENFRTCITPTMEQILKSKT